MEISIQGAIFKIGSMLPKLKTNLFCTGQIFQFWGTGFQFREHALEIEIIFLLTGAEF